MSTRWSHRLIEAAIVEAIELGFFELVPSDDGVVRYQITELGVKYFESVIDEQEED